MFNYNKGWRIDFFLVTPDSFDEVKDCWIDKEFRSMEKPSDHTPLILEI
jgi:exodeoxyribonuclease-3